MIVADNETAVDLLYYEPIARTVVRLISERSDQPLTVGIHGGWGAGKSSVLLMIEDLFKTQERVLCVRFNGWLFQGFDDAKAVLVEKIVLELTSSRSTNRKVLDQAKTVLKRVNWMKLSRRVPGAAITLATGIPTPGTIEDLRGAATAILGRAEDAIDDVDLQTAATTAGNYLREAEPESTPEHMHAFREEFIELLERANVDRLVVLVDDLDRCLPGTAIDTLEAIRLFLFVPNAAFVIAADEAMIEYSVRQHFPDLPVASGPATYARNYLEKLIQVPFRLPSLGYAETRVYITLLVVLREHPEGSDTFDQLAALARSVLQRPWEGLALERSGIADAFGDDMPAAIGRALDLADRISPILTDGARGNPRQVKRFINAMTLRLAIAEERGFREELDEAVLAKLMLAEGFAPELYDAIARSSARTGNSDELVMLETAIGRGARTEEEEGADVQGDDEGRDEPLPEWPNLAWAKRWAAIEPSLSLVDLRPYVFVTRDHRELFGSTASPGHLDELLARLMGPSMQVRQAAAEVNVLPVGDAEQLFEALCAKIVRTENLSERPPGAIGVAAICAQHPFVQPSLVAFLKRLPVAKLGPWVVSGWGEALSESEAKQQFAVLMNSWSAQTDNVPLQVAARAASKLPSARGRGRR